MDYLADIQITARRVLSPELYKTFREIYFENYGNGADGLSLAVQMDIQKRCSAAWKKSQIIPFAAYWHHATPENKLGIAVNLREAIQKDEGIEARRAASRARRSDSRKKRNKNTVRLAVAA